MDSFERTRNDRGRWPARTAFWALSIVCALAAGCRSVADYDGAVLPDELRAKQETATGSVDLSSIASHSINEDLIYPGDVIDVTVSTGIEESEPQRWPLRVSDRGYIDAPLIGAIKLTGLNLVEAEDTIRRVSIERDIFRQPHVSVLMKQRRMIRVRVVGAVAAPGVYQLPAAGSDLLAALVAAGGLSDKAGTMVELRHPNATRKVSSDARHEGVVLASFEQSPDIPQRTVRINLTDPTQDGVDLHVEDGSVVMVAEKPSHSVSVIGLVKRPDNYQLPTDESFRVLDAIALAGGRTVSIADKIRVIRQVPDREDPIVIEVSVKVAKRNGKENLLLAAGDTVSVEETPSTFVVETIRNFIRFGFTSAIPGI